ncbi:MAG: hypothetical protein OXP28_18490 [Gammaproteobacteria bacterium]|nr:hypothetical protein [Gammaproteobacteria bacterium]MDE0227103.1 hypothetical protein [Gammaproteobacteria bacterium]
MKTRRQAIQSAATIGIGVWVSPKVFSSERELRMVARIFFDSYGTRALVQALRYAGDAGFVASLPQLLRARVHSDYDNIIWNTWFSANSEESVVATPQGNHVVVTVHGGGIFGKPARIERALRADLSRHNVHGLTGQYAAKITPSEPRDLLRGRLPDGTELPVYDFGEFRQGVAELPRRYGVVLDFDTARKSPTGYVSFEVLRDDPVTICRAGGVDATAAYLGRARRRNDTSRMKVSHRHNDINPDEPQTRMLNLGGNRGGIGSEGYEGPSWGYGEDWGIAASGPVDMGRYIAVTPRDISTSAQHLDFELER